MPDRRLKVADLSADQRAAYTQIGDWVSDGGRQPILTLGGFAGCGKTTVISVFAGESSMAPIAFAASTGKASSVLRRKLEASGVKVTPEVRTVDREGMICGPAYDDPIPYCGTIHSLIYSPIFGSGGKIAGFTLKEELDRPYQLIIVDEASMITDDMLNDLRSFDIPILAVGDHGQLAPVRGLGSLMEDPDIRLEKIHRQAEDNPIIRLSKVMRETGRFDEKLADGKSIVFDRRSNLNLHINKRYKGASIDRVFELGVICYMNRTRVQLNLAARQARGFRGPPGVGEQVICLKNMREIGVYNGMRGIVKTELTRDKFYRWKMNAIIEFPEDGVTDSIWMFAEQFNKEKTFDSFDTIAQETNVRVKSWKEVGALFDFGSALTAHKSQGSGFDDVLLVVERPSMCGPDDFRRWCYTAITRAAKRLTILT